MEEEDAAEAEAPEEFFDPIMSEIMSDPVTLPSGNVMDRENIMRHLMSDATDPFSRSESSYSPFLFLLSYSKTKTSSYCPVSCHDLPKD